MQLELEEDYNSPPRGDPTNQYHSFPNRASQIDNENQPGELEGEEEADLFGDNHHSPSWKNRIHSFCEDPSSSVAVSRNNITRILTSSKTITIFHTSPWFLIIIVE